MLRVTRPDGFESVVMFRTRESAQAEASELATKSGEAAPDIIEFEIKAV
jgi:hypothetical protein